MTPAKQSVFLNILMPSHDNSSEQAWRIIASRRAINTILAVKIYQKEKGTLPDSLESLMNAGYLQKLPDDPYSAEPLVYVRQGESFILYSQGADFDDDGGVEQADDSWGQDRKGGDRRFWPVD